MSEITPDQYRVASLLDTVAQNEKRHAEEITELKLNQAIEIQNLKAEHAEEIKKLRGDDVVDGEVVEE